MSSSAFQRHHAAADVKYRPYGLYDNDSKIPTEIIRKAYEHFGLARDPFADPRKLTSTTIPYRRGNADSKARSNIDLDDRKNVDLASKTGLTELTVFSYTFRMPETGREYEILWDYRTGLVRTTGFFKALQCTDDCQHKMDRGHHKRIERRAHITKASIRRALEHNKGLLDLCPSITGGKINAQGYWIPYACARALCIRFCYPIRWVLFPVFGATILQDCLPPDHPEFGELDVDAQLVRDATAENRLLREKQVTNHWREKQFARCYTIGSTSRIDLNRTLPTAMGSEGQTNRNLIDRGLIKSSIYPGVLLSDAEDDQPAFEAQQTTRNTSISKIGPKHKAILSSPDSDPPIRRTRSLRLRRASRKQYKQPIIDIETDEDEDTIVVADKRPAKPKQLVGLKQSIETIPRSSATVNTASKYVTKKTVGRDSVGVSSSSYTERYRDQRNEPRTATEDEMDAARKLLALSRQQ